MVFDFQIRLFSCFVLAIVLIAYPCFGEGIHDESDRGTKAYPDLQPQTEVIFLNGLRETPDKDQEWFAARSDHRLLAYAVFNCKGIDNVRISEMPREYYHALLLDLSPYGNHIFRNKNEDSEKLVSIEKNVKPLLLTDNEQTALALSDSIARARIRAADGARNAASRAKLIGILTLIISALATLFVTLQGRMRQIIISEDERFKILNSSFFKRAEYLLFGPAAGFRWMVFFAIGLSIAASSMAGLQQVYDPTRAVTLNTRALAELQELYHEIVLNVQCKNQKIEPFPKLQDWISKVARIRASVITEYDPQK